MSIRLFASWRSLVPLLAALLGLFLPSTAGAQELDTVFLSNGGRVRGTVMIDEPAAVSIRLPDGTTRQLPRVEIASVAYAGTAQTAPVAVGPRPMKQPLRRRSGRAARASKDMIISGIVLTSAGGAALLAGVVLMAAFLPPGGDDFPGHVGIGLGLAGGATTVTGSVLLGVGVKRQNALRRHDERQLGATPDELSSAGSPAIAPGLTLSFVF